MQHWIHAYCLLLRRTTSTLTAGTFSCIFSLLLPVADVAICTHLLIVFVFIWSAYGSYARGDCTSQEGRQLHFGKRTMKFLDNAVGCSLVAESGNVSISIRLSSRADNVCLVFHPRRFARGLRSLNRFLPQVSAVHLPSREHIPFAPNRGLTPILLRNLKIRCSYVLYTTARSTACPYRLLRA